MFPWLTEASTVSLPTEVLRLTIAKLLELYTTKKSLHGLNDLTTEFDLKLFSLLRRKKIKLSVV